jgi:hypothetical protein
MFFLFPKDWVLVYSEVQKLEWLPILRLPTCLFLLGEYIFSQYRNHVCLNYKFC